MSAQPSSFDSVNNSLEGEFANLSLDAEKILDDEGGRNSEEDNEDSAIDDSENHEVDVEDGDEDIEEGLPEDFTPADPASVVLILEKLKSSDINARNEGVNELVLIVYQQTQFTERYILPHVPELIHVLALLSEPLLSDEDDAVRSSMLSVVCTLFSLSEVSRKTMAPYADSIIPYLCNNHVVDRSNIVGAIEELADEPSSRDAIYTSLEAHLFGKNCQGLDRCVIEIFDYILVYGHGHLTKFFLAANSFELVLSSMNSPDVDTRIAAQSCLVQLYAIAETIDSQGDISADVPSTTTIIVNAFMKALHDESHKVVNDVIDFLNGTAGDEVKNLFVQDSTAIVPLILSLGKKETATIGTSAEWFILKFGEGNNNEAIRLGFKQVWDDDSISVETKGKVIDGGVINTFMDIRLAALDAGLCNWMMNIIERNDKDRLYLMVRGHHRYILVLI